MIGNILGNRYELIEAIGEGGMAIVYKAKDKKLNRFVAVKILKKEFADNADISDKFKKEATAVANLSDMNIVSVLDVGHEEEDNIDYFVMELVDGKTLKDIIIYNGKLSWNTAITIGIQVAKALDCAHRNNIIHRDIKPQNILVTQHKDIKVTDFGIAKSTTSATITNTTTIMGSAHYLSPEQAKGIYIDFKSDLYSLGIVLYEMVTGVLPFQGDSPVTVALKHIQEDPINPKNINEAIPESLGNLILKLMSKEPKDRYQSTKEVIVDLKRVKENPDIKILNSYIKDDDKTIIMAPVRERINVNSDNIKNKSDSTYKKEEVEEDYEDEDEDENDDFTDGKGKKIGIIIGIISILLIIFFIMMMFFTGDKVETVTIPDVITQDVVEVQDILIDLGLKVDVTQRESDEEAGMVLDINPKEGEVVEEGTRVELVVSSGLEMIEVPDLRDFEENYIIQILNQKGVKYEIKEVFDDEIEKGYFISQNPEANTEMLKDGTVYVTISKGKETKFVEISDYKGLLIDVVKGDLENLGIEVRIEEIETNDKSKEGLIVSQSLEIGKKVEEGYPITLGVNVYIEPTIEVREYMQTGMLLVDALGNLDLAGFKYQVAGGVPLDTTKYKIVDFTKQIKLSETIQITIERIPDEENEDLESENEEGDGDSNNDTEDGDIDNSNTNTDDSEVDNNITGEDEQLENGATNNEGEENSDILDENIY